MPDFSVRSYIPRFFHSSPPIEEKKEFKPIKSTAEPSAIVLSDGGGWSVPRAIAQLEGRVKKKVVQLNYSCPYDIDSRKLEEEVEKHLPWAGRMVAKNKALSRADAYLEGVLSGTLEAPETMKIIHKVREAVREMDCIFLPGGDDIPAHWYGETGTDGWWRSSDYRALLEFCLIKEARKKGIPVMGVCRGFQVVWVFHGAGLARDLDGQSGVSQSFWPIKPGLKGSMPSIFENGVVGRVYHHQGVREWQMMPVEADLEPMTKKDGLIKAAESKHGSAAPLILTQFHPEFYDPSWPDELTPNNLTFFKILHEAAQVRNMKREGITPLALQVAKNALKKIPHAVCGG